MIEDIAFSDSDLTNGKLILPNTKIVDFSIENENGELVVPPRIYSDLTNSTEVDLSSWNVRDTWHIRKILAEAGKDAEPGVSIEEHLVQMYLLKNNGQYLPYVGTRPSFPIVQEKKVPILGKRFFASGTEQLVSEKIVQATIPCSGIQRQYVGTSEISAGTEGILYQFQVFRENVVLYDITQDSLVYPASYAYRGNAFYFPNLLPARPSQGREKYLYYWRVRASYKLLDAAGNLYWSGWSKQFPFKVNTPPTIPFELSVFA